MLAKVQFLFSVFNLT